MATTYTGLLQLPKHEVTDPFDITLINEMADRVDAGVAKAYRGKAAHNHINNSFFDAAQAGYNGLHGTQKYFADRWPAYGWNATIIATYQGQGVVHLTGGTADAANAAMIYQKIPAQRLAGKAITVAVEVINVVTAGTTRLFAATDGSAPVQNSVNLASGIRVITLTVPDDATVVTVSIGNDSNYGGQGVFDLSIRHPVLYLGTYTAATMPEYQLNGEAAELAECQWYFQRLIKPTATGLPAIAGFGTSATTSTFAVCPLANPMREGAPTIIHAGLELLNEKMGTYLPVSGITAYGNQGTNNVLLQVTTTAALTAGEVYYLVGKNSNSYLDISRDL